jgi:hypothetical protein
MTTFNYTRSRATADRLITRFGQAGAIRRNTAGDGDPWEPGAGTDTDHSVQLAVIDYTSRDRDGTLIQQSDRRVLISAQGLAITPTSGDQVVIGGQAYAIIDVKPLEPGGTVVMYEAQVRF